VVRKRSQRRAGASFEVAVAARGAGGCVRLDQFDAEVDFAPVSRLNPSRSGAA